jgi:hypothetical protein
MPEEIIVVPDVIIPETVIPPVVTPPADTEEIDALTFDGVEMKPESEEADEPDEPEDELPAEAPDWVKKTREVNKELKLQLKEYKRQLAAIPVTPPAAPAKPVEAPVLPAKPTLESVGWDEDEFTTQLFSWKQKEQAVASHAETIKVAQEAEQKVYSDKLTAYREEAVKLNAPDFSKSESAVMAKLDAVTQGILVDSLEGDAAKVVYVLGRKPELLAEIAAEKNPIKLIKRLLEISTKIGKVKVQAPKVPSRVPVESPVKTGAPSQAGNDAHLAALRDEADKTGDRSKVIAFLRAQKK